MFFTGAATDDEILAALANGAKGILLKDAAPDRLIDCVRNVAAGKQWFPTDLVDRALHRAVNRHVESERVNRRSNLTPRIASSENVTKQVAAVRLLIDQH